MKNIQLEIDKKLAADRKQNILCDRQGNCVITIPAPVITVSVGENNPAATAARLTVNGTEYINTGNFSSDGTLLVTAKNLQQWSIIPHLRQTGSIVLSIDAGVDVDRSTVVSYAAAGLKISCQWGKQSIASDTLYACCYSGATHHLGEVAIDVENWNLVLDTTGSTLAKAPFQCVGGSDPDDPDVPDDPISVSIVANNAWCSGAFTESATPQIGSYIWPGTNFTITREETETLEAAKEKASLGKVSSVSVRAYITYADRRYWRDEEKDEVSGYSEVWLYPLASFSGQSGFGTVLWKENPGDSGMTGKVFSDDVVSYDRYPSNQEAEEYDYNKTVPVVEDLEILYNDTSRATEEQWYKDGHPGLLDLYVVTGGTVSAQIPCRCIGPRDFGDLGVWYEHKSQPSKNYPTTHTVWAAYGSRGDYGRVFVDHEPNMTYNEDLGIGEEVGAFYDAWSPLTRRVEYDGKLWIPGGVTGSTWLFKLNSYPAWTLSPCHREGVAAEYITVYTDYDTLADDIVIGETSVCLKYDYGEDYDGDGVNDFTIMPEGFVTGTGEGTYSITSTRNETYYYNGSISGNSTVECADCAII